jgi:hypothetical protein
MSRNQKARPSLELEALQLTRIPVELFSWEQAFDNIMTISAVLDNSSSSTSSNSRRKMTLSWDTRKIVW